MHEQRAQREVEVGPATDIDMSKRGGDVDHPAGRHIQSRPVEELAEVQQIIEKVGD